MTGYGAKGTSGTTGRLRLELLARWGGVSFLAGVVIETCFVALIPLAMLRGQATANYLAYFLIASVAYLVAVARLGRDRLPLRTIWAFAILFRLTLLLTSPPTLSDDVYRYIWDGQLAVAGVSPYALPVDSPLLDGFDSPLRALVNHSWMASPYLPTAQALFVGVYRILPNNALAFQVAAVLFDLMTGWLVVDMLGRLGLPRRRALIYLWHPLVCVEYAHGAHVVDALMIFLMMGALWLLVAARDRGRRAGRLAWGSVLALAAATLTKILPILLLPVLARRWGWPRVLAYGGLVIAVCVPFALVAGWGLRGPLDGEGLFGAIRIYNTYWNFNSGLYHWLEVGLSGYRTPGAVPYEVVGWAPIRAAKTITTLALGVVLLAVGWLSWRNSTGGSATGGAADSLTGSNDDLRLLRLALIPLTAFLLLTTTVHPWYVTLLIPLLPFLLPGQGEATVSGRFLWPLLYFSLVVPLSYVTYWNPDSYQEYGYVRRVEYIPFFLLLVWAALPVIRQGPDALVRMYRRGA